MVAALHEPGDAISDEDAPEGGMDVEQVQTGNGHHERHEDAQGEFGGEGRHKCLLQGLEHGDASQGQHESLGGSQHEARQRWSEQGEEQGQEAIDHRCGVLAVLFAR